MCSAEQGVTLPKDAVRQEANRIYNDWLWEQRQRRWAWSTAWSAMRSREEESPFEPESLGGGVEEEDEDEEAGVVTLPPHSPRPEDLRLVRDLFSQQAGISVVMRWPKWPRTGTGVSSSPPPQSDLMLVSSNLHCVIVTLVVMGIAQLEFYRSRCPCWTSELLSPRW
jgi:hypothetical protein